MIGDVLMSSILFEAIRNEHPNAELHYVINSHTFPVVEQNPNIDKFHFITPEIEKSKSRFFGFIKTLKKERFDVAIDVYCKIGSTLMSYFSGAKKRIAYKKGYTSLFMTHPIARIKEPQQGASLAVENRLRLLEPLGIQYKPLVPKIFLTEDEKNTAKSVLESYAIDLLKPLFMISVLGSSDSKTYPKAYMAEVLDTIVDLKQDCQILFNYIPKQEKDAKAIYDLCSDTTKSHIYFDLYGKSLREFLAITSFCSAVIGNEGGANNMAKALGIKTFTIFSPFINRKNWFGDIELENHEAVHLKEFLNFEKGEQSAEVLYTQLKPEYVIPKLKGFLNHLKL